MLAKKADFLHYILNVGILETSASLLNEKSKEKLLSVKNIILNLVVFEYL